MDSPCWNVASYCSDVRFTLTYRGRLTSNANAAAKHAIRREFHPQAKELWRTHPSLQHLRYQVGEAEPPKGAIESNGQVSTVSDKRFAALIHEYLGLGCELDILVLRCDEPGKVIASHSGDLDNQLKTLLDALRRPSAPREIPSSWEPAAGEQPFHCLLDDDKLITRINVEVDRLLAVPPSRQASPM